jgi:hypothetical protein
MFQIALGAQPKNAKRTPVAGRAMVNFHELPFPLSKPFRAR